MTRAKKIPITSFGPAIRAILQEGTKRSFEIPCDTTGEAIHLAQRLNMLRYNMREAGHPDAEELYRCGIRRKKNIVMVGPRDAQFEKELKALNIPLDLELPTGTPVEPKEGSDPAEDFLASLRRKDND